MSVRVAVLLSGCGVYDGSEIQESVFTLLALDQAGAEYQCCAPDKPQAEVINHATGEPAEESRNVLHEAARIARGKIVPLNAIKASDFDAIALPGGFGAAKNLCDYAAAGKNALVDPEVRQVLQEFHGAGKPIAAVCIAPVILASVFGNGTVPVELTIGNDADTVKNIECFGARHTECPVTEFVVDKENKIITSPAYMYDATPAQVYEGIRKTVDALVDLVKQG
jgi:enhancing lycopene biosynthesis protein 2